MKKATSSDFWVELRVTRSTEVFRCYPVKPSIGHPRDENSSHVKGEKWISLQKKAAEHSIDSESPKFHCVVVKT